MSRPKTIAEQKKARALWQQNYREKERKRKSDLVGYYERDATRYRRLSLNQLGNLYDQIIITEIDDHGLGPGHEEFECHYSDLAFVPSKIKEDYGSVKPILISRRNLVPDEDDNENFRRDQTFQPGGVIMASEGVFATDPLDQVSHLCDNPRCLRFEHLIFESSTQNNKRKNCPGIVECGCCGDMHDACVHTPKCKKITRRDK